MALAELFTPPTEMISIWIQIYISRRDAEAQFVLSIFFLAFRPLSLFSLFSLSFASALAFFGPFALRALPLYAAQPRGQKEIFVLAFSFASAFALAFFGPFVLRALPLCAAQPRGQKEIFVLAFSFASALALAF